MRSIREAERARREKREQGAENESPAERFKMKRFQAAESKFRQAAEQSTSPEGSRKQFLKRSSQAGPPPLPTQPHVSRREVAKPAVPRVAEAAAPVRAPVPEWLRGGDADPVGAWRSRRARSATSSTRTRARPSPARRGARGRRLRHPLTWHGPSTPLERCQSAGQPR